MGKSQSSPPTPPHSAEGDVDNAETLKRLLGDGLAKHSMTRIVTDEWKDLEDVKGAPTREHWKVSKPKQRADGSKDIQPCTYYDGDCDHANICT